ncbi:sensor histidine kinase [Vibrio sp. TBV020]|uniref:sensor histidine kinase n=1 Tax=Vibrio sp. TBV020 TaxID=3137398 RepID=UPI0038CD62F7
MSTQRNSKSEVIKSFTYTAVFCAVIALVTQTIWPSAYIEHLMISLGYGFSSVIGSITISRLKPDLSMRAVNLFSLVVAMVLGTTNAYVWLHTYDNFSDLSQLKPVVVLGFIFTVTCFFYFYTYEQKLVAQRELEKAKRIQSEHEKALVLSQLRQLQSQIEPHFLFNTLANVNALISHDPKTAQHMLDKLTELLRGTLLNSRESNSSIDAELNLIDAYLAIQKIRLGERLDYRIDNQLEQSIPIAPLLMQPLVENAIKHGIEPKVDGGDICIKVAQKDQLICIEVSDSGVGLTQSSKSTGHGIGLQNIRERIKTLYGESAGVTIKQSSLGGVQSSICIPLEKLTT